jgi:hypothetical protein
MLIRDRLRQMFAFFDDMFPRQKSILNCRQNIVLVDFTLWLLAKSETMCLGVNSSTSRNRATLFRCWFIIIWFRVI